MVSNVLSKYYESNGSKQSEQRNEACYTVERACAFLQCGHKGEFWKCDKA